MSRDIFLVVSFGLLVGPSVIDGKSVSIDKESLYLIQE